MQQRFPIYRTGLGQDSRRFLPADSSKPCMIGGVIFENVPGLDAESDGDVVFLAVCNAISSISGVPVLSSIARDLCRKDGITDSSVYVERALHSLQRQKIVHVSISLEGKRPQFELKTELMKMKIAKVLSLTIDQVGITTLTGEGLTDFGCGDGVQALCIVTSVEMGN